MEQKSKVRLLQELIVWIVHGNKINYGAGCKIKSDVQILIKIMEDIALMSNKPIEKIDGTISFWEYGLNWLDCIYLSEDLQRYFNVLTGWILPNDTPNKVVDKILKNAGIN